MMALPATPPKSSKSRYSKLQQTGTIFPRWYFDIKVQLVNEMQERSKDRFAFLSLIAVVVKYSLAMPLLFWKECLVLFALIMSFPRLRSIIYEYTPEWMDDLGAKVVQLQTFSQDDHEPPPELEMDEFVQRRTKTVASAGANANLFSTPGTKIRQYTGAEVDADDWWVFDPVYGVIPISCRDLWNKQTREMEIRREAAISEGRTRPRPPVRYARPQREEHEQKAERIITNPIYDSDEAKQGQLATAKAEAEAEAETEAEAERLAMLEGLS
jgi:hypothetical protein